MLTLRLAWRSFLRHRRRSAITAVAISMGLAMMLMFVGLADDGHARMAEMGIRLGSGHVVVQGKGYQQEQTLDRVVAKPDEVLRVARTLPGVKQAVARVRSGGLLTAGELSTAVLLSGVDPALEPTVSDIAAKDKRTAGHYVRRRADMEFVKGPADIYIGDELAKTLQIGLDDRVVLTVSPKGQSRPSSAAFRVHGIFHTGLSDLDAGYVEIPIREAQKLLGLGSSASQIAVLLHNLDDTMAARGELLLRLDGEAAQLEVLSWQESLRELYEAIVLDDLGMYLMMAIIFVIVGIGIFNTVLMSVTERTREFGVMMAIGTSRRRLTATILTEAAILAVIAAAFGLACGLLGHALIAHYGIDVTALAGGDYEFAGIAFSGKIYSRLSTWIVIKWTLVVMGIVMASALYPALRAGKLKPVEAMRHV